MGLLATASRSYAASGSIEKIQLKDGTTLVGEIKESTDTLSVDVDRVGIIIVPNSGVLSRSVNPPPKLCTVDVTAGYSLARGNSDTDSFSSTAKANRKTTKNETTFQNTSLYGTANGQMNAQSYMASGRYAYSFGARNAWYQFFKEEASHDRFALVEIRSIASTGYGYWWSDTENFRMMAELGVGYEHTEYESERERTNQGVAIPRFYIEKRLIRSCRLSEDISTTWGSEENTVGHLINSETKFTSPVSQRISLEVDLTDHYASRPPGDAKKNDLLLINSIRYSF